MARGGAIAAGFALGLMACAGSPRGGADELAAQSAESAEADEPAAPIAAPDGYTEMRAAGIMMFDGGHTLGLVDDSEGVMVPISIGGTEALSIALRLESESFNRPLTHDLLDAVIDRLGAELVQVQIDRVDQGVFHASVHLRHGDEIVSLDARSSDAVALAVGNEAPIYVARGVLEWAGLSREQLESPSPTEPDEPGDDADPAPQGDDEGDGPDREEAGGAAIEARAAWSSGRAA
jgi:bifunctional DNase/RNase